jgi:hypothetical protein
VAPYTFSRWPGDVDAFEHVAIIGSGVRVRTEPRPDSDTLASLTYAIVPIVHDPGQPPDLGDRWTAVRLPNRRVGFVAAQYARSPIDYRAIFARVAGDWRMVAFVAGD